MVLMLVIAASAFGWGILSKKGGIKPEFGGIYIEGIIGAPKNLNPLFAQSNSERDIGNLVYSGLLKYDQRHQIVPDLAERWEVKDDGKKYTFYLKKNIYWQDGKTFSADDLIFTTDILKNKDYTGPKASVLQEVEIKKINDYTVEFNLLQPFAPFISNLTFKILPRHLWQNVVINNLADSEINRKPIGTGPFKISEIKFLKDGTISQILFSANRDYYAGRPYLEGVIFKYYNDPKQLVAAYKNQEVMGISRVELGQLDEIKDLKSLNILQIKLPQYIALFLNTQGDVLKSKDIRRAVTMAVDKNKIINEIFKNNARAIGGPILPGSLGYSDKFQKEVFNPNEARSLLDQAGWIDSDNNGIRDKNGKELKFVFVSGNENVYLKTAQMIISNLSEIGIGTDFIEAPAAVLQVKYIKEKKYDLLLFGENLGADPDPYEFWHSSQAESGLNLSLLKNAEVDKLLEEARQTSDAAIRTKDYENFQEIIADESPAVFLCQPYYLYGLGKRLKGVELLTLNEPSERFTNINRWYLRTD